MAAHCLFYMIAIATIGKLVAAEFNQTSTVRPIAEENVTTVNDVSTQVQNTQSTGTTDNHYSNLKTKTVPASSTLETTTVVGTSTASRAAFSTTVSSVCMPNPCESDGRCKPHLTASDTGFTCTCTLGRTGKLCNETLKNCDVMTCIEVTDCLTTPTGALCICDSGDLGQFCTLMLQNTTEWAQLMSVMTDEMVTTAEVVLMATLASVSLIAFLIMVHCCFVIAKQNTYREKYDKVIHTGGFPTQLPPDWLNVSFNILSCGRYKLCDDFTSKCDVTVEKTTSLHGKGKKKKKDKKNNKDKKKSSKTKHSSKEDKNQSSRQRKRLLNETSDSSLDSSKSSVENHVSSHSDIELWSRAWVSDHPVKPKRKHFSCKPSIVESLQQLDITSSVPKINELKSSNIKGHGMIGEAMSRTKEWVLSQSGRSRSNKRDKTFSVNDERIGLLENYDEVNNTCTSCDEYDTIELRGDIENRSRSLNRHELHNTPVVAINDNDGKILFQPPDRDFYTQLHCDNNNGADVTHFDTGSCEYLKFVRSESENGNLVSRSSSGSNAGNIEMNCRYALTGEPDSECYHHNNRRITDKQETSFIHSGVI